ncbi:MAG: ATP-binding protein [Salinirussus sp.]
MYVDDDAGDPGDLLGQFAEHTPDILWMFTADWEDLLFINGSYEEIWGRSIDALADDSTDFLNGIHPEFHDEVHEVMEQLSNGESIEHQYRVNPDEDYERWVLAKGEPIYEDGEVVRVAGFVRDITDRVHRERERERRERTLRDIYEVTGDTSLTFDERVERLLELAAEVLETDYGTLSRIRNGEYVFEIVYGTDDTIEAGDTAPLAATNCEITATERRTVVLSDVEAEAPELTEKAGYAEWGIACYIGAPVIVEGEVYGTFCFYDTDPRTEQFGQWEVTLVELMAQWLSTEMTRRRTREQLERQNDRLEDFASVVSHDLRNPLSVAMARTDLASRECDTADLEHARQALVRMDDLIDDLLDLARHGDVTGNTESVDIRSAANDAWSTVRTQAATLNVDIDGTVRADPGRFRRLLENLFRNAIDHGGEAVTVTIASTENGFYVADDGSGIPAEDLDTVFETGFSTGDDGTGLGLPIVRDIAEAHEWTVTVRESAEGGAHFEFEGVTLDP